MEKRKTLIILTGLSLIGIASSLVGLRYYRNEDDVLLRIKNETEQVKQICLHEAFPDNDFNMYGNELKIRDAIYHQCLKNEIISRINKLAKQEDAEQLIKALDKIQEGVLSFYWDLYNRQDYGSIGRGVNDAVLGRYYEHILEDVIHFEYIFDARSEDKE